MLLTLGTLAVRLVGIGCGLPHHVEPDSMLVKHAAWFARPEGAGEGFLCAPDTFYPRLLAWLIARLPGRSYPAPAPLDAGLAAHLAALAVPYLKARIVIACLSVLAVPSTFFLARRFIDPRWSLLAAAFVATSLLETNYAQQARPHAAMAGLMSLGLVLALRLLDAPSLWNYALAGLGAGLAIAGLHNGACVALALAAAHFLARKRSWLGALLALLAFLACFLPAWWEILAAGLAPGERGGVSIGGQEVNGTLFSGRGFPDIARYLWGYEPAMCVLVCALLVLWAARRARVGESWRALLVIAACFVPFVLVFGTRNIVESRFFVPFVPVLALLATGALHALRLPPVLAALALVPQTFVSVKLVLLRSQGETLATAAHWFEEHADRERDAIGLQPTFSLPLFSRRADLDAIQARFRGSWELYQLALPGEPAGAWDLRSLSREEWWRTSPAASVAQYARAERLAYGLGVVPTGKAAGHNQVLEGLRSIGEPVLVLHPYDPVDDELSSSAYEMGYYAFERVWRSRCWGHPVEIVRVK
ncbi:MAG: glycosyltransferase family 39 protein [Planctomycetes bacterium]|nr:glycosyltransferase family 39 protein [Planctomycetota bacterium]